MFEWLSPAHQFTLDTTLILTLLVIAVHLTFRSGLFSLAPMGFAAIGGYSAAILSVDHGLSVWIGLIVGPVLAASGAALFALPVLRLKGIYMALGTLALAQAIVVTIRTVDFTNGPNGIAGIPLVVETWHLLLLVGAAMVVLQLSQRSHFGRAAKAVRLDERTAEGLGISVARVRFGGFVASAAVAALAGGLEAHRTIVISPDQYGFTTLLVVFTYVLVGGNAHWMGPVLVTWGLTLVRELLDFAGTEIETITYGVLLILVMVLAPNGLSDRGLYRRISSAFRRRLGAGHDGDVDPSENGRRDPSVLTSPVGGPGARSEAGR